MPALTRWQYPSAEVVRLAENELVLLSRACYAGGYFQ
jgi:hypothetical protein